MKYIFLLFLTACAALTEEQLEHRADKIFVDAENWYMCEAAYSAHGVSTWHVGHTHDSLGKNKQPRPWDVKDDLRVNQCKRILRSYWVDYPSEDEY